MGKTRSSRSVEDDLGLLPGAFILVWPLSFFVLPFFLPFFLLRAFRGWGVSLVLISSCSLSKDDDFCFISSGWSDNFIYICLKNACLYVT